MTHYILPPDVPAPKYEPRECDDRDDGMGAIRGVVNGMAITIVASFAIYGLWRFATDGFYAVWRLTHWAMWGGA